MIIVGELINASRNEVKTLIETKDHEAIRQVARNQEAAGAQYIDTNAGVFRQKETEYLNWLVENVTDAVQVPCCIDSAEPKVLESALEVHQRRTVEIPLVNSISLERKRFDNLLPILAGTDLKVVALCLSDEGMPETADQRLTIADRLINALIQKDINLEDIYVDPLVQPLATDSSHGKEFLTAIGRIIADFEGVHTICGLSNISYGLPERKLLNQTFMAMAITMGLDAAILNPLDKMMMANIYAAEALIGKDEFSAQFLSAFREGKLTF